VVWHPIEKYALTFSHSFFCKKLSSATNRDANSRVSKRILFWFLSIFVVLVQNFRNLELIAQFLKHKLMRASIQVCQPGVDVMITIFGDFSQFSAKKMAFFLNTNVMINFFKI
jgi:hypothetical protein